MLDDSIVSEASDGPAARSAGGRARWAAAAEGEGGAVALLGRLCVTGSKTADDVRRRRGSSLGRGMLLRYRGVRTTLEGTKALTISWSLWAARACADEKESCDALLRWPTHLRHPLHRRRVQPLAAPLPSLSLSFLPLLSLSLSLGSPASPLFLSLSLSSPFAPGLRLVLPPTNPNTPIPNDGRRPAAAAA